MCLEVAVCASGEWYCTATILGEQLRVIVPERMQLWWQEGSDGYLCEFCALDSFVSPFFFVSELVDHMTVVGYRVSVYSV